MRGHKAEGRAWGRAFIEGSSAPLPATLRWFLSGPYACNAGIRPCPRLRFLIGLQARRPGPGLPAAEGGARLARSSPAADSAVAILCCERARRRLRKLGCGVARFRLVTCGEAATRARPAAIGQGLAEGGVGFTRISRPFLNCGRWEGAREPGTERGCAV